MNGAGFLILQTDVQAALLGAVTGFIAALLGFQINLVALQYGIRYRRRAAFFTGAGAAAADAFLFFLAFAGVAQIGVYSKWNPWVKTVAAAVLAIMAVKLFFTKATQEKEEKAAEKTRSHTQSFFVGFLLVMGNPGMFALWFAAAGFLSMHFTGFQHADFCLIFLVGFMAGALLWFAFLASWLVGNVRILPPGKLLVVSRIAAVLLVACAVWVLVIA